MSNSRMRPWRLAGAAMVATAAIAIALTGCTSTGGKPAPEKTVATQADVDAAMKKTSTINFWGYAPQTQGVLDAFKKAYPNITVNFTNTGSGGPEYQKLENAIKAGSGVPDVAQFDYAAIPQFALTNSILDLKPYGSEALKSKFTAATWDQVTLGGKLLGIPQDSGPMALFYRTDVFEKYGLTVPKTWDEYIADAKKLHAADPSKFMSSDASDSGLAQTLIWQAGGKPFQFTGDTGKINLSDPGTSKFAKMYGQLLSGGLLDTSVAGFTPEWAAGLCAGKYASQIFGGWGTGALGYFCPDNSGLWKVAPIPQYKAGETASAQDGGSSTSVLSASKNKLVAIGFAQFFSTNADAMKAWQAQGGFPPQEGVITSSEWLDAPIAYFGGDKVNQIFAKSSDETLKGWQWLPFNTYAGTIYADNVGDAYSGKISLADGLKKWQDALVAYGKRQGFTINK